jgi:hypothetical protein
MKSKAKLSQEILVGLTEGDFDKIKLNAGALNLVHFFEGIAPKKSAEYRQQMAMFSTANKELIRQAEEKNIYGATLAFNQLGKLRSVPRRRAQREKIDMSICGDPAAVTIASGELPKLSHLGRNRPIEADKPNHAVPARRMFPCMALHRAIRV